MNYSLIVKRADRALLMLATTAVSAFCFSASSLAQTDSRPTLLITNDPVPREVREQLYSKPVQVRDIRPEQLGGRSYYEPTETLVGRKIVQIDNNLQSLQNRVLSLASTLNGLQQENERKSANYYAAVATISTQLQSGTTPGNPRLLKRISLAEESLENLAISISALNQLALDTSNLATEASFLLEETRAAYGLSGAIEEDHVRLAELEDSINNTVVMIERVLNTVNDDITRVSTYLSSERNNLRTLSLGVANGDLYGKSLGNRPFSSTAVSYDFTAKAADIDPVQGETLDAQPVSQLSGPRPLVKIKFDRADVEYEQPVYLAVNEALKRYPDAQFDLVAVHPSQGNAAEVAIESTRSRRNAERVLRTLTQMGLPLDRVNLSYDQAEEASTSEVHLYVR